MRLGNLRLDPDHAIARGMRRVSDALQAAGLRRTLGRIGAWQPSPPVALGLLSALLTLLTLRLSTVDGGWSAVVRGLENPLLFWLNALPLLLWMLFWYYLLCWPTVAFALTAVPALALACANYYKLLLRGDPLLFTDVRLVGEASAMSGRYGVTLSGAVLATVLLACLGAVALRLWLRRAARPRGTRRAVGCAACAALLWGCVSIALPNDALYARTGLACAWLPTQSYTEHGVVYPFLRSAVAAADTPPAGYSEQEAAALLRQYPDADIPAERQVDVVAVMLEAFGDVSTLPGVTFAPGLDPYADWHALQAESASGELVTNIFAGETVNTERAFLTGYLDPSDNFRRPVNSFVWYLRGQGYACVGNHAGYDWFYNRRNVNEYLGFESYHFYEDRYRAYGADGAIAGDAAFLPGVFTDYLAARESGRPVFSFNVTFQNHGPYESTAGNGPQYIAVKPGYDQADVNIANNYLAGIADTGRQLRAFLTKFDSVERPVVVVLFGDHKPWWGDHNTTYRMFGVNLNTATQEGFYNYYTTPYLIWGNAAARASLGDVFQGDGGRIGASMLMERVFTLAGWQGPAYLQTLRALQTHTPFVNRQYYLNRGRLTGVGEGEPAWLTQARTLDYYLRHSAPVMP
ncbi:MAG: LTA synthase family protein [Candidatus Limiplasma sp.]|nr:LTA synthase family protein [Candidatus Limiplasma sp.]